MENARVIAPHFSRYTMLGGLSMKIVVQTGDHVSREDLEYFASKIPSAWRRFFETIVVYGSREKDSKISYHEKEKVLGVHVPSAYKGTSEDLLEEMAISLAALSDMGHVPDRLPTSRVKEYKAMWADIQGKGNDAT